MSASKIKNLVILVLALVNVFLLALVIPTRMGDLQSRRDADGALVRLYAEADVALRAEDIPNADPLYPTDLPITDEGTLPAVRALLGQEVLIQKTEDETRFSSALGEAVLLPDGSFTATVASAPVQDTERETRRLLSRMELPFHALQKDGDTITAVPMAADAPILTHSLAFRYEENALASVTGLLLPAAEATVTSAQSAVTARDALVAFLGSRISTGWMGERVESVTQGYSLSTDASRGVRRLQPVWCISTDVGRYLVDGMTKAITPMP